MSVDTKIKSIERNQKHNMSMKKKIVTKCMFKYHFSYKYSIIYQFGRNIVSNIFLIDWFKFESLHKRWYSTSKYLHFD